MATRSTRSRRPAPKPQPEPQSRAKWTSSLTKILAELMVDQVHKGNRFNNYLTKKAWNFICEEFYKKTGLKWDKEQLKNRYAVLRKQYGITKSILDEPDFTWDEPTGAIVATDEAWTRYTEEHPDAETIRSTGCPNYQTLCTIFSEAGPNGKHNGSSEHEELTPASIQCPQPLSIFQEDKSSSESEEMDDKCGSIIPFYDGGRKRGRTRIDDVIVNAVTEMASASKLRATAIKQHNERFSITECVHALDEMQGVEDRVYFAALDLFNNRTAREIFLSLKVDKRLTWLQGKCSVLSGS